MSYALEAAIMDAIIAIPGLTALLAADADDGSPAIYPFNVRRVQNPKYPLITIAQIGTGANAGRFDESLFAGTMDESKIAVCVFDKSDIDMCWKVYNKVFPTIQGRSVQNQYVGTYRIRRTILRDDLVDKETNAFHLHSEWIMWESLAFGNPIPITP